jgi:CAAX protease family protein
MDDNTPPVDSIHPSQDKWAWSFWPTVGFGLAVGGAYLLVGLLVGLVFAVITFVSHPHITMSSLMSMFNDRMGLLLSVEGFFTVLVCLPLMAVFIRARKGVSVARYLGFNQIKWRTLVVVLAVSAGFLVLSGAVGTVFKVQESQFDVTLYRSSVFPPLLWLELVVLAPLFEETFFRGFLLEGFRQSRMGPVWAVVLTALAWSSLHVQYDLYGIATIFLFGLVLGFVRLKTRSLWSTLTMHAFWNLIAAVQIAIQVGAIK